MSEQQSYYTHNEQYADFLASWDPNFYGKYADTLKPDRPGGKALDVGCGVGQVVARLTEGGYETYGVDVSEPSIARAKAFCARCQVYDGKRLPFADNYFDSAGALNVLEHVDEPEAFIQEVVRVVAPKGKVVISSPNFMRAAGWRDYHPKMRGLGNKFRNWRRIREKRAQMRRDPSAVKFDRMVPIVKEPFEPDDDAIIATNGVEIAFFLERFGCKVEQISCTDRYVFKPLDFALNATPLRYYMFSGFVVGRKL
jgi:SAM-dependent methyltransferase